MSLPRELKELVGQYNFPSFRAISPQIKIVLTGEEEKDNTSFEINVKPGLWYVQRAPYAYKSSSSSYSLLLLYHSQFDVSSLSSTDLKVRISEDKVKRSVIVCHNGNPLLDINIDQMCAEEVCFINSSVIAIPILRYRLLFDDINDMHSRVIGMISERMSDEIEQLIKLSKLNISFRRGALFIIGKDDLKVLLTTKEYHTLEEQRNLIAHHHL